MTRQAMSLAGLLQRRAHTSHVVRPHQVVDRSQRAEYKEAQELVREGIDFARAGNFADAFDKYQAVGPHTSPRPLAVCS